jgi:general secretion pathway protein F
MSGNPQRGEILSTSRPAALETLTARGLIPIEVLEDPHRPASPTLKQRSGSVLKIAWLGRLTRGGVLTRAQTLSFTESLAALLRAGLTIDRALQVSSSLAASRVAKDLAAGLLKEVRTGRTLSAALVASGQRLPPYYVSMVEAGEAGGSLPETVTRVAELIRRQLGVQERIRSALFYPCILAAMVIFTLTMLVSFVLPRFQAMFAESEAPLPWSTHAVLLVGQFIAADWWALLLAAAAGIGGILMALRSPRGRRSFDRWLLSPSIQPGCCAPSARCVAMAYPFRRH